MAVKTAADNGYIVTVDDPRLHIPNTDWSWVTVMRPTDITTTQIAAGIHNFTSTDNWQWLLISSDLRFKANDGASYQTLDLVADKWIVTRWTRSGDTVTAASADVGTGAITSGTGDQTITKAFVPDNQPGFGRTFHASTLPFLGQFADIIFVKGYALTDEDISRIATGSPIQEEHWYNNTECHFYFQSAAEPYLVDLTGRYIAQRTGVFTNRGSVEIDPPEVRRFGAQEVAVIPAADTQSDLTSTGAGVATFAGNAVKPSDLTAAGAGVSSLVGSALNKTDLSAVGAGVASFDIEAVKPSDLSAAGAGVATLAGSALNKTDLTAAGAGVATLTGSALAKTDLTAAGTGVASFEGLIPGQTDLTAAGVGAALFDAQSTAQTDLTAVGAGVATFDTLNQTVLTAAGIGTFSFVAAVLHKADLTAVGAGVGIFGSQQVISGVLTASGVGSASFDAVPQGSLWTAAGVGAAAFTSTSILYHVDTIDLTRKNDTIDLTLKTDTIDLTL